MKVILILLLWAALAYSYVVIDSRNSMSDDMEEDWWKGGVVRIKKREKFV